MTIARYLLFFVCLLLPWQTMAQPAIPEHGGVWVHDEAGVLSPSMKSQIETILKAERDSTTNQIAVLIIPSLEGEILEDYSLRVAEKWKLGKKDRDNGVLWLISIKDRKMRIESGYGLEGSLTDAQSSRINRNQVAPYFRQGDYDGGVYAGVNAIIQTIKGQYVNNDPPPKVRKGKSPWTTLLFILIIIIVIASRGRRGGGMGGMWVAGSILSSMGRGSGSSGSSWGGGGGDYGGGGGFGGGGSSDSW